MPVKKFECLKAYWTAEIPDIVVIVYGDNNLDTIDFNPADPETPAFLRKAFGLDLVNSNPSTAAVKS